MVSMVSGIWRQLKINYKLAAVPAVAGTRLEDDGIEPSCMSSHLTIEKHVLFRWDSRRQAVCVCWSGEDSLVPKHLIVVLLCMEEKVIVMLGECKCRQRLFTRWYRTLVRRQQSSGDATAADVSMSRLIDDKSECPFYKLYASTDKRRWRQPLIILSSR